MRIERTKTGVHLRHGRHLISELPGRPGPTHSVFDVLAAAAVAVAPRAAGRLAMLGFAAGGTVAPLRGLGFSGRIEAVDLSLAAVPAFRRVARGWAGEVTIDRADALAWLAARGGRFDVVLEDLSVAVPGDVTKPRVSWERLPERMARKLSARGAVIVNVLPVAGLPWTELLRRIAAPFREGRVLHLDEFENRLLIVGRSLPPARRLRSLVEAHLRALGSRQAGRIHVRTLPRGRALPT